MPNGRGTLECSYCDWYRCHNPEWVSYPDAAYEAGTCLRHHALLPDTTAISLNRVCRDFQPNADFTQHGARTAEERMASFPYPLAPGVLYGFSYCWPLDIQPIAEFAPNPVAANERPDAEPGAEPDPAGG